MIAERGSRGDGSQLRRQMGLFKFTPCYVIRYMNLGEGGEGAENLLESAKRTVSRDRYDPHRFCFLMHASDLVRDGGGGGDGSL
jgi:hypothetical protein